MTIVDQLGRSLQFNSVPKKVVSLVPSISYWLENFIPDIDIVGITRFCELQNHKTAVKIGGTKNPSIPVILSLHPDIIIANKEENRLEDIHELEKWVPVYVTDVYNLTSMYTMMSSISNLFHQQKKGKQMVQEIHESIVNFQNEKTVKSVCYLIWKNPYMTVGKDTFIHSLLESFGFVNSFGDFTRYPQIRFDDIMERNPDIILLSSEPFPFKEVHLKAFPKGKAILVDGRAFSWYGSYILKSSSYIKALKGILN
jgi:ABC-type Fe3+-hydroxamate transport system substrate-binding protein